MSPERLRYHLLAHLSRDILLEPLAKLDLRIHAAQRAYVLSASGRAPGKCLWFSFFLSIFFFVCVCGFVVQIGERWGVGTDPIKVAPA